MSREMSEDVIKRFDKYAVVDIWGTIAAKIQWHKLHLNSKIVTFLLQEHQIKCDDNSKEVLTRFGNKR